MGKVKATATSEGNLHAATMVILDDIGKPITSRFMVGGLHKRVSPGVELEQGKYTISISITSDPDTLWNALVEVKDEPPISEEDLGIDEFGNGLFQTPVEIK
jgi:hypothetical protein